MLLSKAEAVRASPKMNMAERNMHHEARKPLNLRFVFIWSNFWLLVNVENSRIKRTLLAGQTSMDYSLYNTKPKLFVMSAQVDKMAFFVDYLASLDYTSTY